MENNLFKPMGLKCSYNVDNLDNYGDLAALYKYNSDSNNWDLQFDDYGGRKPTPRDLSKYVVGTNGFVLAPEGGLRISTKEMRELMRLHIGQGEWNGKRIVSENAMALMHSAEYFRENDNGSGNKFYAYGLGTHITTGILEDKILSGLVMWGHSGFGWGLASAFYYNYERYYGLVVAMNGAKDKYPMANGTAYVTDLDDVFQVLEKYFF